MTSQLPDKPLLHVLTDRVAKLEEETDSALTTVAAELQYEVDRLETRFPDIHNTTYTRITTQNRKIWSFSDDLVALTRRVVKMGYRLAQVQAALAAQSETLTTICYIQTSITARLDGLSTAQVQVNDRVY